MFCVNCGTKLEENANFCTSCGAKIGNVNNVEQADVGVKEKKEENIQDNVIELTVKPTFKFGYEILPLTIFYMIMGISIVGPLFILDIKIRNNVCFNWIGNNIYNIDNSINIY